VPTHLRNTRNDTIIVQLEIHYAIKIEFLLLNSEIEFTVDGRAARNYWEEQIEVCFVSVDSELSLLLVPRTDMS